jgi:predicted phage terminase large subunit-like protein
MLDVLRYIDDPNFTAVIFRRESTQITAPGSLWQTARGIWALDGIDGTPREKDLTYSFPSGANVKFSHMELEKDKLNWSGSQLTAIIFDEAQQFSESQVTFMFSRMRSAANTPSYMRLTCNPDPNSYLRRWIDWYLDDRGFPIRERGGVLRYFITQDGEMLWGNSRKELIDQGFDPEEILSFTFIPALVTDNPAVLKSNPKYVAYLKGLPRIEREALLDGCWDVQADAGAYFKREWVGEPKVNRPTGLYGFTRYWDRAGSEVTTTNRNPDWTVGTLIAKDREGYYWILDVQRFRGTPFKVKANIERQARIDGRYTKVVLEQDPGQAGKSESQSVAADLIRQGFDCRIRRVSKDKLTRFTPFSAACEAGLVKIIRSTWNDIWFQELENFTGERKYAGKDDQVDSVAGAFTEVSQTLHIPDSITFPDMSKANTFAFS